MSYGTTELPYTAARIKGIIKATGQITVKPAGLAGIQLDCNGATGDFTASITPANLTGNRRWILPNRDDTFAGLGAQTFTGAQNVTGSLTASDAVNAGGASSSIVINAGGDAIAADRNFQLNTASGNNRLFRIASAGLARWGLGANSSAESGSDAGSRFVLRAYTDAGATIDDVFTIFRAAGGSALLSRPLSMADSTASTSTTTGALVVTGGAGIGGRLNVGGDVAFDKTGAGLTLAIRADDSKDANISFLNRSGVGIIQYRPVSSTDLRWYTATAGIDILTLSNSSASTGSLFVNYSTASTSTTTGALVVTGGVGIGGRLNVGGALEVNSATLIKSNTTLTDGAAAAVGTLTNAPTAGNPTKWVLLNDNGVIRKFPTWT